ncbi:AAA family ATPase [Erythrobacter sp. THAF29]|uniref:AAA family ATPase n=1 Tax=Erythrobacter sp. THAF29 TaxID=2587851 RepID=UPI0012A7BF84|nr:AAA family ATPase [Erythrobacter sp. THAF29]QFT76917.1 hypothetical protein FIU90_05125 [Erythrobacter sp. THAF29]
MKDIFLSYNREDQAAANLFVRGFEAAGLTVWWDRQLRAGEAYDEVTENALRDARAVVVLWSEKAVASRWVRAEATLAQRCGTFVPCMIEPCERPIMFELTQTEDLSHWEGDADDAGWNAFVIHVRDVVERMRPTQTVPLARPEAAKRTAPAGRVSERRQITFVSAALCEGDILASTTDPEDWDEYLTELQTACQPAIERYGGAEDWRGHTLTVSFGYPLALEDAVQRAILMSREISTAAAQTAFPEAGHGEGGRSFKIGIHSSDMLVTDRSGEIDFVGDGEAIAKAARDHAADGVILVTHAARALTVGGFAVQETGQSSHGQVLYEVSAETPESDAATNWETGRQTGFVGREDEMALLAGRWKRTLDGEGQFVFIRGEPGIGKSRLVDQFRSEIGDTEHAWFMLQGSSLFPNTPYFALAQAIQQAIEHDPGSPITALSQLIERVGFAPELLQGLAATIGLDASGSDASPEIAEAQLSQLPAQLAGAIFDLAERRPVVLFLDDLQWFDPSSLELVQMLVEQGDSERLMVLGTARPEFKLPWSERDHHSRIRLSRLSKSEVKDLIAQASGEEALDPETFRSILDKAGGVPLFAEELAKLAARHEPEEGGKLPPTLRSLLAARMDRLGPARELLQLCSVLGTCSYALLEAMTDLEPAELQSQLQFLSEEQLLQVRGAPPQSRYRFKHALLRDGAYETLTKKRRKLIHEEAASKIIEQFPEIAEREKELVASHWTNAGKYEKAVTAWLEAGQRDFVRGASREAAAHLRKGLDLIGKLPEGKDRDGLEMELWSALNNALQQSQGYSDPQTVEAADRARDLAKKLGVLSKVIIGEVQLWRGMVTAGEYEEADAVAVRINELAQDLGDDEQLDWMPFFSANALIQTAYYNGRLHEFEAPYAELEKLFGHYEGMFSVNDDVVAMGVASLAAWTSGRSSLARERSAQMVEVAEASGQPYAVAVAHHFAGTMMAFDRDMIAARNHTERAVEVCDKNGIEYIGHLVRAKIGWLGSDAAPSAENIQRMRGILDAMIAINARVGLVINMNRLGMALAARGEIEDAYKVACEALEANPQERIVRPETLQIKARLEMELGRREAAEADLREAIELAEEIGAMAFDLSASVELTEYLLGAGRQEEAHAVLARVLDRCKSDIDTPVLEGAQALLKKLQGAKPQRLDSSRV